MAALSAKPHLVLVDACPDAGAGTGSASLIFTLPHPRTGRRCRYAVVAGGLRELVRVAPPSPAAWFVDQSVRSDGGIVVASALDALFLLLPALDRAAAHFSPLDQCLAPAAPATSTNASSPACDLTVLLRVAGLQATAAAVCDSRDGVEEAGSEPLLRLNTEKCAALLEAKVRRLAAVLQRRADGAAARARAVMGGFATASMAKAEEAAHDTASSSSSSSSSCTLSSSSTSSSSSASSSYYYAPASAEPAEPAGRASEVAQLEAALGLLAEYVSDAWVMRVVARLAPSGVSLQAVAPHLVPKTPAAAAAAAAMAAPVSKWAVAASCDPLHDIERFTQQRKGSGVGGEDKADVKGKPAAGGAGSHQSFANKQLVKASANMKGLKQISSFFAPKPAASK